MSAVKDYDHCGAVLFHIALDPPIPYSTSYYNSAILIMIRISNSEMIYIGLDRIRVINKVVTCNIPIPSSSIVPLEETWIWVNGSSRALLQLMGCSKTCREKVIIPVGAVERENMDEKVLYCSLLYYNVLYCIVLYFIVLCCIVLYCIAKACRETYLRTNDKKLE